MGRRGNAVVFELEDFERLSWLGVLFTFYFSAPLGKDYPT